MRRFSSYGHIDTDLKTIELLPNKIYDLSARRQAPVPAPISHQVPALIEGSTGGCPYEGTFALLRNNSNEKPKGLSRNL